MRLLPGFSRIRRELGKICSIGAMRDKYDLDPFTETSCSEHRKKGSMKIVAPSR